MGLINRQPSNGLKFHRKTSNNQFISVETWLEVVALHIRAVNRHLKKISDTVGRLVKQPQYYLSRQIGIVFFTLRPSKLGTPPPNGDPASAKLKKRISILIGHTITAFKIIICPVY